MEGEALWNEWGRATRFLKSVQIALDHEADRTATLPHDEKIRRLRGVSEYEVSNDEHISATRDFEFLYALLLLQSYGLAEAAAGQVIAKAKSTAPEAEATKDGTKKKAAKKEAAPKKPSTENRSADGGIEAWGAALLKLSGKTWSDVKDGEKGAVELATIRNRLAHGSWTLDEDSIVRLERAGCTRWKSNDRITMTHEDLEDYRARLRALLRVSGINVGRNKKRVRKVSKKAGTRRTR